MFAIRRTQRGWTLLSIFFFALGEVSLSDDELALLCFNIAALDVDGEVGPAPNYGPPGGMSFALKQRQWLFLCSIREGASDMLLGLLHALG